jgi:hypothetical protein
MPTWLSDILKDFGFSPTPFIYATAVFGFFAYLDKESSDPAREAIASWFKPFKDDKSTATNAVVELFDLIYTRPLLGWRAFLRSSLISVVLAFVFLYEVSDSISEIVGELSDQSFVVALIGSFIFNILSDYVSLFVIRRWLFMARERTVLALLMAPMLGVAAILLLYLVRLFSGILLDMYSNDAGIAFAFMGYVFFIPAIAVHLWLPLFALGVLFIQAFTYFSRAVGWTQWFIKDGANHPLRAIGYVAAVIVFVGTIVVQKLA